MHRMELLSEGTLCLVSKPKGYDPWQVAVDMDLLNGDYPFAATALQGKHAFVCGASKGIGEATAKNAGEGWR